MPDFVPGGDMSFVRHLNLDDIVLGKRVRMYLKLPIIAVCLFSVHPFSVHVCFQPCSWH